MKTHVLHEASSPAKAIVWTMWCGHQCIAMDGEEGHSLVPEDTDFVLEREASQADCVECLAAMLEKRPRVERKSQKVWQS
jgi:hypothetical protein